MKTDTPHTTSKAARGPDIAQTIRNATEAIKGLLRENAELRARLSELHDWMRAHTGAADGAHDMLCRSHSALNSDKSKGVQP